AAVLSAAVQSRSAGWVHKLIALLCIAILVALPFVAGEFLIKFATRILIFGLAAISVDLLLGYAGLVSFGHAAFLAIGAYTAGIVTDAGFESAFVVWACAVIERRRQRPSSAPCR